MNHIYKIIFNKATGFFVVVPEFARSQGKVSRSSLAVATAALLAAGLSVPASARGIEGGTATSEKSIAIYTNANVSGDEGVALGYGAVANSNNNNGGTSQNVAIGVNSKAVYGGVSIGFEADTMGTKNTYSQSVAIGYRTKASGDQSTALGAQAQAVGNSSIAIGGDDLDKVASTSPPEWNTGKIISQKSLVNIMILI